VLIFQTDPQQINVEVTGPITVKLYASSSCCDTDFTAKLIDVYPLSEDYPNGLAINLTDSIIRARYHKELLNLGKTYEFTFQLYPTFNIFKKGHRICLDISSSNFPRFDMNPNTGSKLGAEQRKIAEQSIFRCSKHPSQVVSPIIMR